MSLNNPLSKLIPDIAVIILYFFSDSMMDWQLQHPAWSGLVLMALNIAAIGLGCFSFFSMYANDSVLIKYGNSLSKFQSSLIGLSAFISCLGFFWWLVPFAGLKALGVQDTGFIIGMTIYFITFLAVVAMAMSKKENILIADRLSVRVITMLITTLFFFFAYCLLKMTMQHWHPSFMGGRTLSVLCLCVFYLPLRFFLLLRPPFSRLEYVSFVLSFGYLLAELFYPHPNPSP